MTVMSPESATALPATLSILLLEDNPFDAELTCASIGFPETECAFKRVDNRRDYEEAIGSGCFDLILADYSLPSFDGGTALRIARQHCPDTPFIFVSGALGEELAIDLMKEGATDYVLKHKLDRLRPSVLRALREKEARMEKQRAEEKLRALAAENKRLYEEAQRANVAKDEFIAMISHELRTPMTAILGWTRMLKLGDLDGEDFQTALNAIERSATVQAQLIEDLLDLSRINTGKLTLQFDTVDLVEVVTAAADAIRVGADEKGVEIVRAIGDDHYIIRGDRNRLQQVVGNLLQNSVKFTPEGGRVAIELTCSGKTAFIRVSDTGIGIRREFLPLLFEPFSQDESGRQAKIGLGLGLSIVRHIVERHGGRVHADSEGEGRGATFTVTLPLLKPSERGDAGRNRSDAEMPDLKGRNVLVVEDDVEARGLVTMILSRCGADVAAASSVADARAVLDSRTWDAIVSDIAMPKEDGYALMNHIQNRFGDNAPPVIALTAFGAPEDRKRIAAAGFAHHLMKPIDPFIFARTVASTVEANTNARQEG